MDDKYSQQFIIGINDIPSEMLEKIFEKLFISASALTLLRCREVCKLWKHRIEKGILNKRWNEKLWFKICEGCVPRNTALEFLNIGTMRIKRRTKEDITFLAQEINRRNAPDLKKLRRVDQNSDTLINLEYDDGCFGSEKIMWRRLFFHCMVLSASNSLSFDKTNCFHESKNFRTDILEPDPVSSIRISGDMIITGHSTGTIWFWTKSGNSLDCIPVVQSGSELRDCIRSMHLIDAYKNGRYTLKDNEGYNIFTDHHALALLSTSGNVYLCSLYISQLSTSISEIALGHDNEIQEKFASRCKSITELQNWKISCVNVYGDVIITGTSLGGKIFLLQIKTDAQCSSKSSKVPELQNIRMLSFTEISPILSSGVFHCNLWHLNCSNAWSWQCITLIHRTGSVYRCHLSSLAETNHQPSWKRFAEIRHQYGTDSIVFENGYRYDWDQVPFHLILPYHYAQEQGHKQCYFVCHSPVPMKTIVIGNITYAVLPSSETLKVLEIRDFSMTNRDDIFESCSIYRDDVFILITRATKQLLVSVDGYYYKVYTPLQLESFCGSYISAVHYSFNLLLLGTSDGRIRAYSIPAINGILALDLESPSWEEEAGMWSFGMPVSHIHIGLLSQVETENKFNKTKDSDESVSIVIAYENNSMTVIKRSLNFTDIKKRRVLI